MVGLDGGTKADMKLVSIKARKLLLTFTQYGNRGEFGGNIRYDLSIIISGRSCHTAGKLKT